MTTKSKNRERLSSRMTFAYKFLIPFILIAILIVLNIAIKGVATKTDLISVNIVYLAIMPIGYLPISNIKKVHIDSNKIYYSNYLTQKDYNLSSIFRIKRWLFFCYKIFIEKDGEIKKIKFLPREFGSIRYLLRKPESIINLERFINYKK